MVTFNENRILDHFIKSISVINQTDKNELWNTLIYYIDSQRRLFNEDNDDELTLWKYFTTNIDEMLDKWCEKVNIESKLYESIKTMYSKRFDIKYKYVSKIGIISPNGINVTKDILDKVLSLLKYKYTFNYDGTPYYLFESFSDDSSKTNHEELINELKKYSEIFIKVEYLAKEIS
jgi:hypothetical protein